MDAGALVHTTQGVEAAVGSSNLTTGAWRKNTELDLVVSEAQELGLAEQFEDWWEHGAFVDPGKWPRPSEVSAKLQAAMDQGVLVVVSQSVKMSRVALPVPSEVKKLKRRSYSGSYLRMARDTSFSLQLLQPKAREHLTREVNAARRALRPFSIPSPWGARFVPKALVHELVAYLAHWERRLEEARRACVASVLEVEEWLPVVLEEGEKAWRRLVGEPEGEAYESFLRPLPPSMPSGWSGWCPWPPRHGAP